MWHFILYIKFSQQYLDVKQKKKAQIGQVDKG